MVLYNTWYVYNLLGLYIPVTRPALRLTDDLALVEIGLFGQAMVGSGEDDPDVKALTIALVNGRIVDAAIRCLFYRYR